MALDVTTNTNYLGLETAEKTVVDTAVAAIKAAYTQAATSSSKANYDNIRAILIEQVNVQEGT